MSERSREQRFDEVYQIILIIVGLSFDILYESGRFPLAEIAVFMWILTFWAYGNLKGGIWEYPLKIGSFNLAITLMTNFYVVGMFRNLTVLDLWEILLVIVAFPLLCLIISLVLASYLKEAVDRTIALPVLIGGTLGYVFFTWAVLFLV
ncbi:MAG: hypothetical protein ACFFF9_05925 [Candidatus Thorarchaeota archaeon]